MVLTDKLTVLIITYNEAVNIERTLTGVGPEKKS